MISQTSLQLQLQFLDLVHSIHRHRISSNKFKYRSNYIVHFIDFGYSIMMPLPATLCYLTNPQGVFPNQKLNVQHDVHKRSSSRIHPFGIPNAWVVQATEGWDWITCQSLRQMMRIQNSHGLIVDDCSMSWVVHPPTNSQHSIVEGVECKRM